MDVKTGQKIDITDKDELISYDKLIYLLKNDVRTADDAIAGGLKPTQLSQSGWLWRLGDVLQWIASVIYPKAAKRAPTKWDISHEELGKALNSYLSQHGRRVTHFITVLLFDDMKGGLDREQVRRINTLRRGDVMNVMTRLPLRIASRVCARTHKLPPSHFFVIVPERRDAHGNEVLWHLHIILAFTPEEQEWFEQNKSRIISIGKNISERVDLDFRYHETEADNGVTNYILKNMFHEDCEIFFHMPK